jgi:hypothetical protein
MDERKKVEELLDQVAKATKIELHTLGEAELDYPIYRDDKSSLLKVKLDSAWKKYDGKKVYVFVFSL